METEEERERTLRAMVIRVMVRIKVLVLGFRIKG